MRQDYFFGQAKWVGRSDRTAKGFSVLRGCFQVNSIKKVTLHVLGLGFFKCYMNGVCINPDTFLPLSSDYESSRDPKDEILSGHRIYVPCFDVTSFVKEGDNVIAVWFGGGWYTHKHRVFGLPKAIYRISVEEEWGTVAYGSDETCRITDGNITDYDFVRFEHQGDADLTSCFGLDFDHSGWPYAVEVEPPDTEYCLSDCPTDKLMAVLPVREVGKTENGTVYDCGQNTTGYPVLALRANAGETVRVLFSEELLEDQTLDLAHSHKQEFSVVSNGMPRTVQPEFIWYGFRYFEVIGEAVPQCVKVIHADVPVSASFNSDNETLNWIYETFVRTMLCNLHTGHPSDCPHIERRGYTGDGQLTCHAVLSVLDAEAFYRKWLRDIADGQDALSGHIQYTAPYLRSGGGPGGWGCAIVEVPYQLYKHFGDKQVLSEYYGNMRRYIDYLEAHSEFGLVTSDKEGEWCLGDWCGPNILYPDLDITSGHAQQVMLPAAFVNTYFMVKSLQTMCEIAAVIGKIEDVAEYEEKIASRKKAISAAYFNAFDHNFMMNVQGANAYAVDLGLGAPETYRNLVHYYQTLGHYDTGIFATDILTRILFERGEGELAVLLLTGKGPRGFEHWRQNGATTFHEYWDSDRSRSHNHPMFGAPVAYFFEYLLGIRQKDGTAGYGSLVIEPQTVSKINCISGSMKTPNGTVSVAYEKDGGRIRFRIQIPPNTEAVFRYSDEERALDTGENVLERNLL